jgi:heme oxygenase
MTIEPADPTDFWLARLAAAQPADVLQRLTALEAQQTTSTVALAALTQMIHDLKESLMASVEDVVSRLNTATTEIAGDLQALRDQLQSVRDEIPAAQQAAVDSALTQLDAPIARLEALGQDPSNPVPDPTPTPEPTPEPAPGEVTPG